MDQLIVDDDGSVCVTIIPPEGQCPVGHAQATLAPESVSTRRLAALLESLRQAAGLSKPVLGIFDSIDDKYSIRSRADEFVEVSPASNPQAARIIERIASFVKPLALGSRNDLPRHHRPRRSKNPAMRLHAKAS